MGVTELRHPTSRGDGHEVAVVVRSDARTHSHERTTALLPDPAADGLLGGDGSLWQSSSLDTVGASPGSQGLDDEPTQGSAVHQSQQERRQRRGRDRRGVEPSGHAVRWREVGRATASPAGASGETVGGEGAHGTLQSKASDCLRNLVVTRLPVGVRH